MAMEEQVILVDEYDNEVGVAGKLAAHIEGKLHRAFSIFVFDSHNRLLLQQRAAGKYHSAGLWSNTCCSHPRPREEQAVAAHRRLDEEMGIGCALTATFSFVYRAGLGGNMIEHEFDHVLFGRYDGDPRPNPEEVAAWKWMGLAELARDLDAQPGNYSFWLRACFAQVMAQGKPGHDLRKTMGEPCPEIRSVNSLQ